MTTRKFAAKSRILPNRLKDSRRSDRTGRDKPLGTIDPDALAWQPFQSYWQEIAGFCLSPVTAVIIPVISPITTSVTTPFELGFLGVVTLGEIGPGTRPGT